MADRNRNQRSFNQGGYRQDEHERGFAQQPEQLSSYGRDRQSDEYGYADGQFGDAEHGREGRGTTYGDSDTRRFMNHREREYSGSGQSHQSQGRYGSDNRQDGGASFPPPRLNERHSEGRRYEADRDSIYRNERLSDPYRGHGRTEDRGFFDKAGDEIASWFGDNDATRRREQDHRGRGPSNYTRSDDRILEDVCEDLTQDYRVDARNIQVTVADGEVTLDGTVDSRGAKRRAEDVAHDCSGVSHVQNNLRIKEREDNTGRTDTTPTA